MLYQARQALVRIRELFSPRSPRTAEQDEEFRFHIEMETAENIRRGMSAADAHRAALLRFGGQQRFREETSDARGIVALDQLARDTRFALRRIRRAPGFALGVIATLGIGIGAAAGIGTIVYGVLLRDLPYEKPDQLVRIGFVTDGISVPGDLHSEVTYVHLAKGARTLTELGAYYTNDGVNLTDGDIPERVTAAMMTPSTFTLLGARPVIGRLFTGGDPSRTGEAIPILISEGLWRRRYGADPSIIGRRIEINRSGRIVVGVLPRTFDFPFPAVSVYYPESVAVSQQITSRYLTVIGRLRDGSTIGGAEADLNALISTLSDRYPKITPELLRRSRARATVESLKDATIAPVRAQLLVLGVLVIVVLLVATTNVVNLFLLRTERASQEIAIALSLGASRGALAQRFVVEGVVLGLASAMVALPATSLALSTKFGFTDREIPRLHEVSFTSGAAVFVLACAVIIGASVGAIALTRTGTAGIFDRLRAGRTTATRGWRRAQNGLVAFQVAIALTLLIAAGLLGRSFQNLRNADIGFEPANAMTFQMALPRTGYATYAEGVAFHARLMDRLARIPGVTSVSAAMGLPLTVRGSPGLELQLRGDGQSASVAAMGSLASPNHFKVLGMPMRSGRSFQAGDLQGAPAVVVSERLALNLFGRTDAAGRSVYIAGSSPRAFRIVGVVGDVPLERIEDGYTPMMYFPLLRDNDGLPADSLAVPYIPRWVQYVIRGDALPSAPVIQGIVKELEPRVPPTSIRTLGSLVDDATARVRLTMFLIAYAGGAALLLGVIGVYSVVSYAAAGRVREFGIRLALGAAPRRIGSIVLGDGLRLVVVGAVAGLAAALAVTRFLRALLYEVEPTSVAEFALATAVMVTVTLVATALPARRAAQTDPAVVLRGE